MHMYVNVKKMSKVLLGKTIDSACCNENLIIQKKKKIVKKKLIYACIRNFSKYDTTLNVQKH